MAAILNFSTFFTPRSNSPSFKTLKYQVTLKSENVQFLREMAAILNFFDIFSSRLNSPSHNMSLYKFLFKSEVATFLRKMAAIFETADILVPKSFTELDLMMTYHHTKFRSVISKGSIVISGTKI